MKLIISCLMFLLATANVCQGRQGKDRLHAAKMAYIADRLKLQPEQSGRFIPIYNEFEEELRVVRKQFYKKYHIKDGKGEKKDDVSARMRVEEDLEYQQKMIDLKVKYADRFRAVLSPEQLGDLYVAEREFRQLLMKQLKERKGKGPHRNPERRRK